MQVIALMLNTTILVATLLSIKYLWLPQVLYMPNISICIVSVNMLEENTQSSIIVIQYELK